MKLYRHYKNKPYKYLGTAHHSESQEELVLYETLYPNDKGSLWVRPKEMFFSSIEKDGQTMARFQKVEFAIRETTKIADSELAAIATLMKLAFGEWDSKWFFSTFEKQKNFFLLTAFLNDQPVAFKLGYEKSPDVFYSWLGGVAPETRGIGLAAELMKRQHDWCKNHDYKTIQTKTQNRFRSMLLLNIRYGFNVVGIDSTSADGEKIVLEKDLMRDGAAT